VTDYVPRALAQALGYAVGPAFANVPAVAACIGAAKLAIGGYFILAITERSPALSGKTERDYGALDFALHGAVALTMLQVIPAWLGADEPAVRMHTANVMLICVIVGTSMFERETATRRALHAGQLDETARYLAQSERRLAADRRPLP
jgi:hypothetical protein